MAGYKITKKDEYYTYEAPGHNECKLCRLHDPQDIEYTVDVYKRQPWLPHYFQIQSALRSANGLMPPAPG